MAVIKVSILRVDEALLDLRLRSMHSPEKKDSTISAIAEGAISAFSASIFNTSSRSNSTRFSVSRRHFVGSLRIPFTSISVR